MRIAVTGATGFIGRALCGQLGAAHELRAVAREPDWAAALDGMQAVVHLAGQAHGRGDARSLRAVNVDATRAAAEAARASGAHFVFISTIKVHGEESAAPLREASPIAPRDAYAQSKVDAEEALRAIAGLRLTVLRPPLVYGPGVKANFLALMRAISRGLPLPLASIDNRRSLVYVANLVDAIARCVANQRSIGRTYLVTDGEAPSTPALCRAIGAALERPARLFPFPPALLPLKQLTQSLEADATAIRGELGFQPAYTLQQGLRLTARWYLGR